MTRVMALLSAEKAASAANDNADYHSQLQGLLTEHRANRRGDVERVAPFSWTRVIVSLISYALLLSDVLRTGLGIRKDASVRYEPDRTAPFGPYAYSMGHIMLNATAGKVSSVWAYKFDSTSIGIRSYAEFFQLPAWPPCLLYKSPCPAPVLEHSTVFRMLDALVEAMVRFRSTKVPNNLTLRTRTVWVDRLHHFILPRIFDSHMKRISQMLYYDAETLSAPTFVICSPRSTHVQPYACNDFWTNFSPICREGNPFCKGVGRVFEHTLARLRSLQARYPNMTLDLAVIESQNDLGSPAFSSQGPKGFDIVTITRVRNCTSTERATIAVSDFRYEGGSHTSTLTDWFVVVAILRSVGQAYAWLRLALLFVGCYVARSAEPKFVNSNVEMRLATALRTMLTIPSQVVVYGSLLPIVCYTLAHFMDSTEAYGLVSNVFSSPLGVIKLQLGQFLRLSAVMMRTVWVMALVLHIAVLFLTKRRMWAPPRGVVGAPELAISFISCLPMITQLRLVSIRDSRVVSISPMIQSARFASMRMFSYDTVHSFWGPLLST